MCTHFSDTSKQTIFIWQLKFTWIYFGKYGIIIHYFVDVRCL